MVAFYTLLLVIIITQIILVNSFTWFPDHERGAIYQARWKKYKAISHKTKSKVEAVCGKFIKDKCSTPAGRPSDGESNSCDRACCHTGHLTGFCRGNIQVDVDIVLSGSSSGMKYKPSMNADSGCKCTNDPKVAACGPDGSFLGIRCPFDRSACARKCCLDDKSGGSCGGFLRLKCNCD